MQRTHSLFRPPPPHVAAAAARFHDLALNAHAHTYIVSIAVPLRNAIPAHLHPVHALCYTPPPRRLDCPRPTRLPPETCHGQTSHGCPHKRYCPPALDQSPPVLGAHCMPHTRPPYASVRLPNPGIPGNFASAGSLGRPKFSSRSRITLSALRLRRYGSGALASSRPTEGSRLDASV